MHLLSLPEVVDNMFLLSYISAFLRALFMCFLIGFVKSQILSLINYPLIGTHE